MTLGVKFVCDNEIVFIDAMLRFEPSVRDRDVLKFANLSHSIQTFIEFNQVFQCLYKANRREYCEGRLPKNLVNTA